MPGRAAAEPDREFRELKRHPKKKGLIVTSTNKKNCRAKDGTVYLL